VVSVVEAVEPQPAKQASIIAAARTIHTAFFIVFALLQKNFLTV
jgi:hypothetical protein